MRTRTRLLAVAGAAVMFAGCFRGLGGSDSDAQVTVAPAPDSALRIAATQLQHHGYTVTSSGESAIITTPRPVPEYLAGSDATMKGRQWMVQVSTARNAFSRGTKLTVAGYLVPANAQTTGTGAPSVQQAIPVTRESKLFQEVRAITGWIQDAANRK